MKEIIIISALVLTSACAVNPKISELNIGVKSATFVQHGEEPLVYKFGVVDGKSFWASADVSSVGGVAGAGAQIAASTASAVASDVVQAEQDKVPNFMRKMINGYPLVGNVSAQVFPVVAQSWHQPYQQKLVKVVPRSTEVEDKDRFYTGPGQDSDLVLVMSVSHMTLDEKPTVGGAFAAAFTAGFNDKTVVPVLWVTVTAYKKDIQSNRMKRVWSNACATNVLGFDGGVKFSELEKDPTKGQDMVKLSADLLSQQCKKTVSHWQ